MQNQDVLKALSPQQSYQSEAKIKARLGDGGGKLSTKERLRAYAIARADPSNDRLLLYEILLEEYESMDHSHLLPPVSEQIASEIKAIQDDGEVAKRECAGKPEEERDRTEEEFNGRLTKKVYQLLRQEHVYQIAAKRARFEEASTWIENVGDRQKTIDRALNQDMSGSLEDERKRFREELEREAMGEDLSSDELDIKVEEQLITRIHAEVLEARTAADGGPARGGGAIESSPGEDELGQGVDSTELASGTYAEVMDEGMAVGGDRSPAGAGAESSRAKSDSVDGVGGTKRRETLTAQTQRSAICLSGGGIRSATFNLGILQGLARYGLLGQFDYLSTVSGGGFVGGWLSAWIQRKGLTDVMKDLKDTPESPLKPEAEPITHLRNYSNFLSPKLGLLYADTWSLIGTLLRNMLLTWLVFVPFLIAVLMLPRFVVAFIHRPFFNNLASPGPIAQVSDSLKWWFGFSNSEMLSLVIGFLAGWLYLSYIGVHLPSTREEEGRDANFFKWCLLPMVISAIAFSIFWLRLRQRGGGLSVRAIEFFDRKIALPSWSAFVISGIVLIAVPWIVCTLYRIKSVGPHNFWKFVGGSGLATLLIGIAQIVNGLLLLYATDKLFHIDGPDYDTRLYTIFAVPILMAVWSLSGVLMAGFTSRYTLDEDQEWWARAGAWIMITMVAWVAVNSLVLYGPDLFDTLSLKLKNPLSDDPLSKSDLFKIAGGIFSVVAALYGGFSARTPANPQQAKKAGLMGKLVNMLLGILAFVALAFLLIMIVILTDIILISSVGKAVNQYFATTELSYTITDHKNIVFNSASWYLIIVTLIVAVLCVLMGWLINTNRFSLHYMWRDRIIRAYMGASRKERNPNQFTGFDTCDNTQMYKLRPDQHGAPQPPPNCPETYITEKSTKLLHVINIALNLTGSNKLAWQDRKAESFTVSPLHCGSYWLGYRRSWRYGGLDDDSISLGTAVAISGAFVSPNMGYMMTSPILRFLMALFNVRFGWWLGNPGRAGEDYIPSRTIRASLRHTFNLNSPRLSVKPIVKEAFGLLNDKSDYVYLSDGGHFENLGLYEMVLRRCRFIVVSDASTDADYTFSSLAMSIRQIRVDLGVPIEMKDFTISGQAQDKKGKYCSIGTIRYSCVDGEPGGSPEEYDGVLIYIKAALVGDEPRDVLNYSRESGDFPQEVIVDQWFGEAQFESYRMLGSHIIRTICGKEEKQINLATFLKKVREHNQLNYNVFNEQISYAALEHQFKEDMAQSAPEVFREKVREYIEKTLGDNDS